MKNKNFPFQAKVLLALVLGTLLSCTEIAKKEKDSHPANPTSSIFTISLEDGITHQRVIGLKEKAKEIQYVPFINRFRGP